MLTHINALPINQFYKPKDQFVKFSRNFFENWRFRKTQFFWVGHFEFFFQKKIKKICFIPMKISPNLYGRMDWSKFWCFSWFPENSLLCVILRYTVYLFQGFDKKEYRKISMYRLVRIGIGTLKKSTLRLKRRYLLGSNKTCSLAGSWNQPRLLYLYSTQYISWNINSNIYEKSIL